ncbi:endonuclease/exonuclease/phosphatase family protein [Rhodanobacter sp. Col0626]|uniref:endonuclease/exonuclease/phosphatase family protein n=1 Tax=Rhodanobacter sp. Col0626 TaxID=3415679 RepID=UPI003CF508DB
MRPIHLLLIAGMLALSIPPAMAQTLRVMSFNVRYPNPDDGANRWENRRDLMVRTIEEQRPDVLGTQELFKLQGDYLVGKLKHYTWFGRGRYGDDRDEHMGVFYRNDRLRLVESGNFWLSETPDKPGSISWGHPMPRMVTWAMFELKASGQRFYYANTHFPYRDEDEPARTHAAQEIVDRLHTLPATLPIVLTGDFNTTPASPAHALLTKSLQDARLSADAHSGPEATFHNFTGTPDKRIDWILYRGLHADTERTVTTQHDGHYPSDHFPVVAEFQWPAPRKAGGGH